MIEHVQHFIFLEKSTFMKTQMYANRAGTERSVECTKSKSYPT